MWSAMIKILALLFTLTPTITASPITKHDKRASNTTSEGPTSSGDGQDSAVKCVNTGISILDCSSIGNTEIDNGNFANVSEDPYLTSGSPTITSEGPTASGNGQESAVDCINDGVSIGDCSTIDDIEEGNGNVVLSPGTLLNVTSDSTGSGTTALDSNTSGSQGVVAIGNGQESAAKCENNGVSIGDCSSIGDSLIDNGNVNEVSSISSLKDFSIGGVPITSNTTIADLSQFLKSVLASLQGGNVLKDA